MKHLITLVLLIGISSALLADQKAPVSMQKPASKPQLAKKVLPFPEPQMERNYNWLTNNLRCQKCANQTLADSEVDLAADLRDRVYQQVLTGKSKEEIVKFLMQRFGDRVSYDPPFKVVTVLLWTSPFLLLLYGLLVMKKAIRNRREKITENSRELSRDEEHKLALLLGENDSPIAPGQTEDSRNKSDDSNTNTSADSYKDVDTDKTNN